MRAARYYGRRDVRIDDVEEPSPAAGEVVLDVAACGICGSEVGVYLRGGRDETAPRTMGHEIGGTVVEASEDATLAVGTAVAVNPFIPCRECERCDAGAYNLCRNLRTLDATRPGGYAERVAVPAENVIVLPDGVAPETAAVAEPLAVAYHALSRSPQGPGDAVAVVGLGPIGLGLVQLAALAGAGPIYASGHREARRAIARECGADVVVDPRETDFVELVRAETTGGVDVSFEVAGRESALEDAVAAVRPNGHTTLVGVYDGDVAFDPMALVGAQRTVEGSTAYQMSPLTDADFGPVLRGFASGALSPERLVTARTDIEDIVEAGFEALADGESGAVKVLVEP